MSLRVALVIDGEQAGAKRALEDTATGIGKLQEAAGKAADPVRQVGEGLKQTATEADKAGARLDDMAEATSQSSARFDDLRTLALGAIGGIAGALATAGLEALIGGVTTAVVDFTDNILSAAPQIRDALVEHETLIKAIKGAYAEADGAASSYGSNSVALLTFQAQQNIQRLRGGLARGQEELASGSVAQQGFLLGAPGFAALFGDPRFGAGTRDTQFEEPVRRFREQLAAGRADVIAFRDEIASLASDLPIEDSEGRALAEKLLGDTAALAELQAELQRAGDLYLALGGNAEAAATALGGSADKFTAIGASLPELNAGLAETDRLLGAIGARSGAASGGISPVNPALDLGFATGGWTGGQRQQVRGVVHGEEFVVRAGPAARYFGLLEAINAEGSVPGYASGGYVGSPGSIARSGAQGGFSVVDALVDDLSMLSGAVTQLVRDLWDTRDPLQALGSVVQSVSQNFLNSALGAVTSSAENALSGLFSSAATGLFGGPQLQLGYQAGVGHAGAVIGRSAQTRLVDAALFDNAPRHHAGAERLAPGEVPFIGMAGEEIGWPDQLARKYGGGTTVNYWNVETPSPRAFLESRASLSRAAGQLSGSAWRHS